MDGGNRENRSWSLFRAFVVCVAVSHPSYAQSVAAVNAHIDKLLETDHARFAAAFKMLQLNIAGGTKLAQEYEYPVTITIDGNERVFDTYEDFLAVYGQIVTPAIVKVVKLQKYKDLKVSSKGVMFGTGQLWVSAFCETGEACTGISWEISAVNH
jgi:hypothetical protein